MGLATRNSLTTDVARSDTFIGNVYEGECPYGCNEVCAHDWINWKMPLTSGLFSLRSDWEPAYSWPSSDSEVAEDLPMQAIGNAVSITRHSAWLARYMQQIYRWQRDDDLDNNLWLYHKSFGESKYRRWHLEDMRVDNAPKLASGGVQDFDIELARHWIAESAESTVVSPVDAPIPDFNLLDLTAVNMVADLFGYDLPYRNGTHPARICQLKVESLYGVFANRMRAADFWIGFKRDTGCGLDCWTPRFLNPFDPVMGSTDFDGGTNASEIEVATLSLYQQAQIYRLEVPKFYKQMQGKYILLGKTSVTGDEEAIIYAHARYGFPDDCPKLASEKVVSLVPCEHPYWENYGVIDIPHVSTRMCANSDFLNRWAQACLYARAPLGTQAEVTIHEWYLIPLDAHAHTHYTGCCERIDTFYQELLFNTHANGKPSGNVANWYFAINPNAQNFDSDYSFTFHNWSVPETGTKMSFVGNYFENDFVDTGGGIFESVADCKNKLCLPFTRRPEIDIKLFDRWLTERDD